MPPRKSLLGSTSTSTPTRSSRLSLSISNSAGPSTLKRSRSRRHLESSPDPLALVPTPKSQSNDGIEVLGEGAVKTGDVNKTIEEEEGNDQEKELEAWQDFAADHYEMVEQLPLELHRNFRLLRELDDGCLAQIERLHHLTRHYVTERLELEKQLQNKRETVNPAAVQDVNGVEEEEEEVEMTKDRNDHNLEGVQHEVTNGDGDIEMNYQSPNNHPEEKGEHAKEAEEEKKEDKELIEGKQITEGIPISDGQGGLFIPITNDQVGEKEEIPARLQFPQRTDEERNSVQVQNEEIMGSTQITSKSPQSQGNNQTQKQTDQASVVSTTVTTTDKVANGKKRKRPDGPHAHLPEIARLSRELVRTAEEKVAVAVGAYNAIDRHIRALDSALTAQEASILLGLRPSTLPSAAVDGSLNLPGDLSALPGTAGNELGEGEEEEMVLGVGGRGRRGKNRKGRKGKKALEKEEGIVGVGEGGEVGNQFSIPPDPNEPRYCYCHQVSYGEMIGCENDECPLEWFHLACAGLTAPPTGTAKWFCNLCKPKIGLGKGGVGKVGNKNITGVGGGGGRKKR